MSEITNIPSDPRIRRTRQLLQDALQSLLARKSFSEISITDICREAEIARVTFYQHYDSKEALLLTAVADFFASLYETIDPLALDHYLRTGEIRDDAPLQEMPLAGDPSRIQLVGVALQYIGSDVRRLSIPSLQEALREYDSDLNEKDIAVLATFYIGGVLTLLEQFLNGHLTLTATEFQETTLPFLRFLRQGMIDSSLLRED